MAPRVDETKVKPTVRLGTWEEVQAFHKGDGYETTLILHEENGVVTGRTCLSFAHGEMLAHDTEVTSEDAHAFSRLLSRARKVAKAYGVSRIHLHIEETTPQRITDLWVKAGWVPRIVILSKDI